MTIQNDAEPVTAGCLYEHIHNCQRSLASEIRLTIQPLRPGLHTGDRLDTERQPNTVEPKLLDLAARVLDSGSSQPARHHTVAVEAIPVHARQPNRLIGCVQDLAPRSM